jgi:myo-inositol-1(or 4)-monophosphatase
VNDTELAISVVGAGAEQVRQRFRTPIRRIDKGAGDFATDVDLLAENAMLSLLHGARPGDRVRGEESGHTGPEDSPRVWLLDPLCGTLNFAARMPIVGVNAALVDRGDVVAAAVADPFSGDVFWTDGRSASVRATTNDSLLVPDSGSGLVDLNLDPPFPSAPAFKAAQLAAADEFLASFRPRVVSSSVALTWVASGQRAAYITDGDLHDSVHFCAGLAICHAAGCTITDLHGDPLANAPNGAIVAADGNTHSALLGLTQHQRA